VTASISFPQIDSVITYYNNGNIKSIVHYNNGVRDGEAKFYWKDGKIKRELSYFNGRVDGLVSYYDKNGVFREMFNIVNGKREGPTSYFDSAGIFIKDVFYTEGFLDVEEELLTYSKFDDVLGSNEKNVGGEQVNKKQINKKVDPDQILPPEVEEERGFEEDPAFYLSVEVMPEPIGGMKAIYKKIYYPENARKNNIEGTVTIRVFIDRDGEVLDAQVIEGIGYGCDDSARMAIFYHRFKPGLQRGQRIKVQMDIPIEFKLQKAEGQPE
jgi:TonB family protein